jgi:hypothetical protein
MVAMGGVHRALWHLNNIFLHHSQHIRMCAKKVTVGTRRYFEWMGRALPLRKNPLEST